MSSNIWTQCAGASRVRFLKQDAWRVVEDQFRVATRGLVDSDAEQARLEELIDGAKPPLPKEPPFAHLHYLLATPFRYPPRPGGSRFRAAHQTGVWYGSSYIETALAETAFHRLRFLNESAAEIRSEVTLTAFSAGLASKRAVDLSAGPFAAFEDRISNKTSYADSQALAEVMRADRVEFCRYVSARDPKRGLNCAVFTPAAFTSKTLPDSASEHWHCYATKTEVGFHRQSLADDKRLHFKRADFEVDGKLPLTAQPS